MSRAKIIQNTMGLLDSIFSSKGSASNGVVGIDIGSSSIKVVELKEKNGIVSISTYGEIQLGPYADKSIGEPVTLSSNQEQEALVDIIRESAVGANRAVYAMSLASSFVTNVSLEADADADLSSMVRVEARKVIPSSLSEVTLDWAEVEVVKKEGDDLVVNRRDVLIAAIQNSALEKFKVLMQFIGMKEPPSEIECFSVIRSIYDADDQNVAVIDIGSSSSKLYIVRKGLLMRMHRVQAGGAAVTRDIAKELNISFEEAETKKLSLTKDSPEYSSLKRVHDACFGRAFREFNQVIREYENKTGLQIESVYLTGGGALFPGVDALLKEYLNKEVWFANPFSKVAYPAFMEDVMKKIGPTFAVSLGAAMRYFD